VTIFETAKRFGSVAAALSAGCGGGRLF